MKRSIILTSQLNGNVTDLISLGQDDLFLCADGGLLHALRQGLMPDILIGDMDSLEEGGFDFSTLPKEIRVMEVPREKDQTDTGICLEYALSLGSDEIVILGGLSGRLDHTLANLQNAVGVLDKGVRISILDEEAQAYFLSDGILSLDPVPGSSLSVFSLSPKSTGVFLQGVAYPLEDAVLDSTFPLGVSNGFIQGPASIRVGSGILLILCCRLKDNP